MNATAPMVVVEQIWKRHGRTDVLRGVDLTVEDGQVVCVIGPSGAGKSSLLRCVNHLERVDSGRIVVDGELIGYRERDGVLHEMKEREVCRQRANIGMVFQSFNLYAHLSVMDNVILAPTLIKGESRSAAVAHATELLAGVGLAHRVRSYPAELSGGEQQRVAIARALAIRPKVVLFDEPTSALDPELVGDVLETIRDLAGKGITMMIVTHEIAFARDVSDVVAFMDQGRIVESGPPGQVLTNPRSPRLQAFLSRIA